MSEREKLNKQHIEIIGKAIDNGEECQDMYDVDRFLVTCALKYLPIKILKKIIKDNEVAK